MSKAKTLFMESTEILPEKTAAEIQACLVQAGATAVNSKFEAGKIVGLQWSMRFGPGELHFAMPARVDPLYQILLKRRSGYVTNEVKQRTRAQAERVAWRQLLRWVQAQLAMIETGMAKNAEVFMPYLLHADGTTFFEYFESKQLKLPAPEEK